MGYNKTVVVCVFGQQIICCPQTQSTTVYFCRPHTRVFYFFVQKEGHHLAASLLISSCQEHFICPVCDNCTALVVCPYMRVFPLLNRSDVFLAPLTRRQKNSVSNSKTTIYVPEQSRQCTFIPCQTSALCKSRKRVKSQT